MAKKKTDEITEIVTEEIKEQAEEIVEEIAEKIDKSDGELEKFVERKLKAINRMDNKAKAQRLAERVLRNRKGK